MLAQQPVASIEGLVSNTSGDTLAGAAVSIRATEKGSRTSLTFSNAGLYALTNVLLSEYEFRIEADGYNKFEIRQLLRIGL